MISALHIGTNLRRFAHGTLPPLAILVVLTLPLLFGGLFVWSYYDPIGNLNRMPVALVNSDTGVTGPDGTEINAGQQVAEGLLERQPLDFHLVDAEEARRGIADGTYYLGLEIPTDFSQAAVSVNTPQPHRAKLNVTLNETNGFIPTIMGNQATTIAAGVIGDTISQQVVNQLFVGFNTIGGGLDEAAAGARRVNEGAGQAVDGGQQLGDGAGQLNSGAHTLQDGLSQLRTGATRLDDGVSTLQGGVRALDDGIGKAADGAAALSDGMSTLQGGTAQLGEGASQIAGGVDRIASLTDQLDQTQRAYADVISALDSVATGLEQSPVPGTELLASQTRQIQAQFSSGPIASAMDPSTLSQLKALQAGAHEVSRQLNDSDAPYRSGVDQATAGAQALAEGLRLLKDGSGTLVAGVATLKDGSSQLVVGANAAADGSTRLAAGTDQLVMGVGALRDGLVQLDGGSGELAMRLGDGAAQAPRWEGERLDAATSAASSPVTPEQAGDPVTYFGKGLSPFFLSLALWVGGLSMFMVLTPMSRRAVDSGVNPFRALLATLIPAFILGFGQAALLWAVQVLAIGVHPSHPGQMFAMLWFISWVFLSLITAINSIFGPAPGRLITMALMSVQLVASNGLYPTEVQPRLVQWLHQIDPMRYSVDLLRYALFGTQPGDSRVTVALTVLALVAVGSWAAASAALWVQRVIPRKDIHPEITV